MDIDARNVMSSVFIKLPRNPGKKGYNGLLLLSKPMSSLFNNHPETNHTIFFCGILLSNMANFIRPVG